MTKICDIFPRVSVERDIRLCRWSSFLSLCLSFSLFLFSSPASKGVRRSRSEAPSENSSKFSHADTTSFFTSATVNRTGGAKNVRRCGRSLLITNVQTLYATQNVSFLENIHLVVDPSSSTLRADRRSFVSVVSQAIRIACTRARLTLAQFLKLFLDRRFADDRAKRIGCGANA